MTARGPEPKFERSSRAKTLAGAFAASFLALSTAASGHAWPSEKYRAEPVAFFREVLGVAPWSRQVEIIEAVRDCPRVTVRSGHKVAKSNSAAGIALWFYCSFPDARVVMSSVTSRQVDEILWRELTMRHARALVPIGGEIGKLARTGLKSNDFRQIVGFTAAEAEAVAGISGSNLLYILDEASGIPDIIYEAIEGNRAGGARVLMLGNPTRNEGVFYESHTSKRDFYRAIHISSEETPNVVEGRDVIPGLACRDWVEEKRAEWGEDSALYQVRVRGEFPREESRKVVQLHLVTEAEERWEDTSAAGRLNVGVDPAGLGDDDAGLVARRGAKVLEVTARRGLEAEELVGEVIQFVRRHRQKGEQPAAVKVDTTGGGGGLGGRFAALLRERHGTSNHGLPVEIEVFSVDASVKSPDQRYPLMRDALWFATRDWLREGGALPPERFADGSYCAVHDKKLSAELTGPTYGLDMHDRPKVEPKEDLKKRLKRSPDRADALSLAVYEPSSSRADNTRVDEPPNLDWYASASQGYDPYAALSQTMGGPPGGRRG